MEYHDSCQQVLCYNDHQGPTCTECTHDYEEYLKDISEYYDEMQNLYKQGLI